jgi:hypothetical protein
MSYIHPPEGVIFPSFRVEVRIGVVLDNLFPVAANSLCETMAQTRSDAINHPIRADEGTKSPQSRVYNDLILLWVFFPTFFLNIPLVYLSCSFVLKY